MERKRNIVFVQCDSMDGRAMGCMGHPAMAAATPHMDRLASQGVLFENAYCNNPICCPSRASMWSGQYTHHCEGWNNYKGLEEGTPTFGTALSEAGYNIAAFGKSDYVSGKHTVRARVSPWTRSAGIARPHYRMEPPEIWDRDEHAVHAGDWRRVEESIAWVREAAADDRPFMLYLGLNAPHPKFLTSKTYLAKIDESGVGVPPEDMEDHPVMAYQRVVKNWQHGFSEETVKTVRRIYFAMIAEVDAMLGRLVSALEEMKLTDSTYLIFGSDHGELAMEHRQFYKMSLYEASVRVPLIVSGPDVPRGKRVDELVSLVDVFPTLTDMAGLERPAGLDGHSLMPLMNDRKSGHAGWALSECHDSSCLTGSFMLRQGDWKYNAYPGYSPQLFHLGDDPDELRNLAGERTDIAERMDALLRSIVDYEAVDAKVKAYDRDSFRAWRDEQRRAGTYAQTMAVIHSGFDRVPENELVPWTAEDEQIIEQWLERGSL